MPAEWVQTWTSPTDSTWVWAGAGEPTLPKPADTVTETPPSPPPPTPAESTETPDTVTVGDGLSDAARLELVGQEEARSSSQEVLQQRLEDFSNPEQNRVLERYGSNLVTEPVWVPEKNAFEDRQLFKGSESEYDEFTSALSTARESDTEQFQEFQRKAGVLAEQEKVSIGFQQERLQQIEEVAGVEGGIDLVKAIEEGVDTKELQEAGFEPEDIQTAVEAIESTVVLETGERIDKPSYEALSPSDKSILDEFGTEEFARIKEEGQKQFESAHTKLGTGEWITREDYWALTPEQQKEIFAVGTEEFTSREQERFQTVNVPLDTGEWVPRDEFESLSPVDQSDLREFGVERFQDIREQELEEFERENLLLDSGEWVNRGDWEAKTSQESALARLATATPSVNGQYDLVAALGSGISVSTLRDAGFAAPDIQEAQETSSYYLSTTVLLDTGERVSRSAYEGLTQGEKDYLNRVGSDRFSEGVLSRAQPSLKSMEMAEDWEESYLTPAVEPSLLQKIGTFLSAPWNVSSSEKDRQAFEAQKIAIQLQNKYPNLSWAEAVRLAAESLPPPRLGVEQYTPVEFVPVVGTLYRMDAYKHFGKKMPWDELVLRTTLDAAAIVLPVVGGKVVGAVVRRATKGPLLEMAEKAAASANKVHKLEKWSVADVSVVERGPFHTRLLLEGEAPALVPDAPMIQSAIAESQNLDKAFLDQLTKSKLSPKDLAEVVSKAGLSDDVATQIVRTRDTAKRLQEMLQDTSKSDVAKHEAAKALQRSQADLEEVLYPRFRLEPPEATRSFVRSLEERQDYLLKERSGLLKTTGEKRDTVLQDRIKSIERELSDLEVELAGGRKLLRDGEFPPAETGRYSLEMEGGFPGTSGTPRPGSQPFKDLPPEAQSYMRDVAEQSRLRYIESELVGTGRSAALLKSGEGRLGAVTLRPMYREVPIHAAATVSPLVGGRALVAPTLSSILAPGIGVSIRPTDLPSEYLAVSPAVSSIAAPKVLALPVPIAAPSTVAAGISPVPTPALTQISAPSLVTIPSAAGTAAVTSPFLSLTGVADIPRELLGMAPVTVPGISPISIPGITPVTPPAVATVASPVTTPIVDPIKVVPPPVSPPGSPPFMGPIYPSLGKVGFPGLLPFGDVTQIPRSIRKSLKGRKKVKKGQSYWAFPGLQVSFPDPWSTSMERLAFKLSSPREREYGVRVLRR